MDEYLSSSVDDYELIEQVCELEIVHQEVTRIDKINRAKKFAHDHPDKAKEYKKRWYDAHGKMYHREYYKNKRKKSKAK